MKDLTRLLRLSSGRVAGLKCQILLAGVLIDISSLALVASLEDPVLLPEANLPGLTSVRLQRQSDLNIT